jgi:solute carrier family 25 phosphate transporter 23/24/25/41
LNAEGDTSISEETLEGLGRKSFLSALFGIIMKIADSPKPQRPPLDYQQSEVEVTADSTALSDQMYESKVTPGTVVDRSSLLSTSFPETDLDQPELTDDASSDFDIEQKKSLLREILPDPG